MSARIVRRAARRRGRCFTKCACAKRIARIPLEACLHEMCLISSDSNAHPSLLNIRLVIAIVIADVKSFPISRDARDMSGIPAIALAAVPIRLARVAHAPKALT